MSQTTDIQQLVTHLFRHEAGKMTAVLTKIFGLPHVELAEDIVQETLVATLETWKIKGIPDNPRAWLYKVAKNRTLDALRRQQHFDKNIASNIAFSLESEEKTVRIERPHRCWPEPHIVVNALRGSRITDAPSVFFLIEQRKRLKTLGTNIKCPHEIKNRVICPCFITKPSPYTLLKRSNDFSNC